MKKKLLALLLAASTFQALAHVKNRPTRADALALGEFKTRRNHPWPFSLLSIGHNMQSYQNYGGSPYWHDGLDIRARENEVITASAGGKVVNIENYVAGSPLYWEVAILDDDGFVWKYHHVERSSIPEEIFEARKTGRKIKSGTVIGNVVRWGQSSYGEIYHHLHLLIVGSDGKYINPFLLLDPLEDDRAPVIHRIGLARDHRVLEGSEISGAHSLFVEASDLVLHDKFVLPPHKISYRLDGQDEKVVWEFVHLPSGSNDTDFINDFYLKGTCGNYSCRKVLINLNFSPENPRAQMRSAPGQHTIDVTVQDVVGNESHGSFNWTVR